MAHVTFSRTIKFLPQKTQSVRSSNALSEIWWVHFDPDTATLVSSTGFLFNLYKSILWCHVCSAQRSCKQQCLIISGPFLVASGNVGFWTCLFSICKSIPASVSSQQVISPFFLHKPYGEKAVVSINWSSQAAKNRTLFHFHSLHFDQTLQEIQLWLKVKSH